MCLTGRFRHATEMTNFEHSLRIPMMIAAPGIRGGVRSPALTKEMERQGLELVPRERAPVDVLLLLHDRRHELLVLLRDLDVLRLGVKEG